ncbi:hypothetical protein H0H92_012574 [Tricholoma furcatifolium]|nr:hypothetical protein H0H92_012574 [Tricholoma furcatifolium]
MIPNLLPYTPNVELGPGLSNLLTASATVLATLTCQYLGPCTIDPLRFIKPAYGPPTEYSTLEAAPMSPLRVQTMQIWQIGIGPTLTIPLVPTATLVLSLDGGAQAYGVIMFACAILALTMLGVVAVVVKCAGSHSTEAEDLCREMNSSGYRESTSVDSAKEGIGECATNPDSNVVSQNNPDAEISNSDIQQNGTAHNDADNLIPAPESENSQEDLSTMTAGAITAIQDHTENVTKTISAVQYLEPLEAWAGQNVVPYVILGICRMGNAEQGGIPIVAAPLRSGLTPDNEEPGDARVEEQIAQVDAVDGEGLEGASDDKEDADAMGSMFIPPVDEHNVWEGQQNFPLDASIQGDPSSRPPDRPEINAASKDTSLISSRRQRQAPRFPITPPPIAMLRTEQEKVNEVEDGPEYDQRLHTDFTSLHTPYPYQTTQQPQPHPPIHIPSRSPAPPVVPVLRVPSQLSSEFRVASVRKGSRFGHPNDAGSSPYERVPASFSSPVEPVKDGRHLVALGRLPGSFGSPPETFEQLAIRIEMERSQGEEWNTRRVVFESDEVDLLIVSTFFHCLLSGTK